MMDQYHLDWAKRKPLSRLREAMHVMRTFLDDGKIDFEGDFFQYTGLFTAARPVQERIPLLMGGMKGPRSFEVAGEIADGLHHALSYSRPAYDYVVDHVKIGAERGGRDWQELDLGAWIVSVVSEDSAAAKAAARILVAFYIPSMPAEQLARHGIDQAELQPIFDAFAAGRRGQGDQHVQPRDGREAVGRRHARGVRRADQARHRPGRDQPHHPGARRRAPGRVLLRPDDRRRPVDPRPAAARGRADVPGDRLSYLDSLFGLDGQTAVVTGATSGLGAASALALAQAGARVIVSGRDRERGEGVVEEIEAGGGSAALELADALRC